MTVKGNEYAVERNCWKPARCGVVIGYLLLCFFEGPTLFCYTFSKVLLVTWQVMEKFQKFAV